MIGTKSRKQVCVKAVGRFATLTKPFGLMVLLASCANIDMPFSQKDSDVTKLVDELLIEDAAGQMQLRFSGERDDFPKEINLISNAVLVHLNNGNRNKIAAARFQSDAHEKSLFPTLSPSLSINQEGAPVASLNLNQLIFSNGQFRSQKDQFKAKELETIGDFLIGANQDVFDVLVSVYDHSLYSEQIGIYADVSRSLSGFKKQAKTRALGGVADKTEFASFQLKSFEVEADLQSASMMKLTAQQKFHRDTGGLKIPAKLPILTSVDWALDPPDVLLAKAKHEVARATQDLETSRSKPKVSANFGQSIDLSTGQVSDDFSIGVGIDMPLGFGSNAQRRSSASRAEAAAQNLVFTREDVQTEIQQLTLSAKSRENQLPTLTRIRLASEQKLEEFSTLFLNGTVAIDEAVSTIESYKKARLNLAQTQRDIAVDYANIARLRGQLVFFKKE